MISTLEALAVLISLKVFFRELPSEGRTSVQVVPTWTGNRGNLSALKKLMTTRYPASAVVMELASHLKKNSPKATVQWAPRTANHEADSLANRDTSGFNPALECKIEDDGWTVHGSSITHLYTLPKLFRFFSWRLCVCALATRSAP